MQNWENKESKDLANAIDSVLGDNANLSFRAILSQLRYLEREFALKAESNKNVVLEVRRRIAEAATTAACLKNCSYITHKRLFEALCRLGFSSLSAKVVYYVIFARNCSWSGHTRTGLKALEALETECNAGHTKEHKRALKWVREVLAEFREPRPQTM